MPKIVAVGETAELALCEHALVPPPRPPQFVAGATADLRDAMARFSGPETHEPRRAAILDSVAGLDLDAVEQTAASIMNEHLTGDPVDVVVASWTVPTSTLASMFELTEPWEQIRADTEAIARVIGRNEPSSAESDDAAERLLAACGHHPDPVAVVSILYQNHDATSGLIRSEVVAAFTDAGSPDGATTRRVATEAVTVGDLDLAAGQEVTIDLSTMRDGAGPHRCPGEALAMAIARGVVQALDLANYRCEPGDMELDATGVATRLAMRSAQ